MFYQVLEVAGPVKIRSIVGTLSDGSHLHISLTDKQGQVFGGHVFGPLVASGTVEAVAGDCTQLSFARLHDLRTGYPELVVKKSDTLHKIIGNTTLQRSSFQEVEQGSDMTAHGGSAVKVFALRLAPGEDIVENLKSLVTKENLKAAFIMTCVGSVTKARIRLAYDPATNPPHKVCQTTDICDVDVFSG